MPKPIALFAAALVAGAFGCQKPVIESFTASPPSVQAGEPVTLAYDVSDAEEVTISVVGEVPPGSGTVQVQPFQTTSYVLTATNGAGTTTSEPVTVQVHHPAGWEFRTPTDYAGDTLTVELDTLTSSERVAVIVLNIGGADYDPGSPVDNVTVDVSGTVSFPKQPEPEQGLVTPWVEPDRWAPHLELQRLEQEQIRTLLEAGTGPVQRTIQAAPAPVPATASFCIRHGLTTTFSRRDVTLRHETAHAAFFVDDADLDEFAAHEPGIWNALGADWEGTAGIHQTVTSAFGPESDVDDNQKLLIVFSSVLGAPSPSGVILGYFSAGDLLFQQDTTAACTGSTSNAADIFYMNAIQNLVPGIGTATEVIGHTYPATLAHEFQHLINANAHCLETSCTELEVTWLNEGLSMVAEDVAGYGWHADTFKASLYLDRLAGPNYYGYNRRSLTVWEGDPIGNYEGSHTFVRYWADRIGGDVLRRLVAGNSRGTERLETVLARPFELQMADWTTALMFSNEPFSPSDSYNFTGASWTPFHLDVGYVNYVRLNPGGVEGQVRRDGWNAFVTGTGTGGNATVTVTSTAAVKPHVVVVRFGGSLPQCNSGAPDLTGACHDIE